MSMNYSKEAASLQSKKHFQILDGLRGIAALSVVVFHYMEWIYPYFSKNFNADIRSFRNYFDQNPSQEHLPGIKGITMRSFHAGRERKSFRQFRTKNFNEWQM